LRRNGAYRCQRVLDAVMELFQDQFLQLVGGVALPGFDARLLKQRRGAELGLGQQQPKTHVFCRQNLLR